jgi:protein-S-isoprenylcysteine O-methyltransferase Ste14
VLLLLVPAGRCVKERMRPRFQREQLPEDKLLMGAFLPLWLGWYVLMGLDRRLGWSSVPESLQILGAILLCLGIWLSWQVLKENSYAAPGVKVRRNAGTR